MSTLCADEFGFIAKRRRQILLAENTHLQKQLEGGWGDDLDAVGRVFDQPRNAGELDSAYRTRLRESAG